MIKYIGLLTLFISSYAFAEPMCRLDNIDVIGCHVYWFVAALLSSIPIIILIILARILISRKNYLHLNISKQMITYFPMLFVVLVQYAGSMITADLTIYDNTFYLVRDLLLIPTVITVCFYTALFIFIRKKESTHKD